ncbi:MAG: serine/threonine-protein phosphatase [Clostridia bacterium]|nr:serine/threonine-protein phosphatase [Clostridia bacterium]
MKKLKANVCAVTHAGRIRKENEDNYDLNGRMTSTGDLKKGSAFVQSMTEPFHLSVCDGMGGESYGELASGIAVETIAAHAANVYESGEDFSFAISNCLDDANSRICAEINARGKRMGTTLAAMYAIKGKVICVNIGDTRVYHYSKGILEQISFDHTHAQTIVDAGEVSMDNISRIPDAKRLTRHLGVFPEEGGLSPNISVIDDVDDGDIILLCSDGLTDMLSDDEITAILSTGENAQGVASKLVRRALEVGGKDNITVMTAFMNVEETAIFAPIAAAMVGDSDADYEEEYRNSFGSNAPVPDNGEAVSPYANADARAYSKPVDKSKIMKIAGAVIAVVILVLGGALVLKGVLGDKEPDEDSTSSTTYAFANATTYPVYSPPTTRPITTWVFTSAEETTEESTTEESTTRKRVTTTRKKNKVTTTKRKTNTTKKASTTKRPSSSAAKTTAKAETTNNSSATTTRPVTEPMGTTAPATTNQSSTASTTNNNNSNTTDTSDFSRNWVTAPPTTKGPSTTKNTAGTTSSGGLGGVIGGILGGNGNVGGVEFSNGYIVT